MGIDGRLADLAARLERAGWAAEIWDPEWRLLWVSEALKRAINERDEDRLGYGRHYLEARLNETWRRTVTDETRLRAFEEELPIVAAETPGGKEALRRLVGPELAPLADELEPREAPLAWTFFADFVQGSLPPARIVYVAVRLRCAKGASLGTLVLWGSGLPPHLLTLVARGDVGMFERMARLADPGRHPAAILFADLEASSALSRRLSSAAYFDLIRSFTTTIDSVVVEREGIVGKHAGDGVTAFFLADDTGSNSSAARAALEAGRGIRTAVEGVRTDLSRELGALASETLCVNVGLHWGGAVYMGQVVTGGRLEVTALGDEVNEAARIEQSAQGGSLLASKILLEQLGQGDAAELALEPDRLSYTALADVDGASDKARRDAGTVAVTAIAY
jgi:class 3 adenylate cyclase